MNSLEIVVMCLVSLYRPRLVNSVGLLVDIPCSGKLLRILMGKTGVLDRWRKKTRYLHIDELKSMFISPLL